jgi:hypothetical protein
MEFNSIIKTFAFDYRQYLVPTTCILAPAFVEIIDFSSKCYHDSDLLQRKWTNIKDFALYTFQPRPSESLEEFKKRFCNNLIKTATIIAAVTVTAWGFIQLLPLVITSLKIKSIWSLYDLLPCQNNFVVKLEYFSLALAHAYVGLKKLSCKNKAGGMFHLCVAISAIAFPYIHIAQGEELRLHHSFVGLALQLIPNKSLKTIGTFIAIDSALYSFSYQRGYIDCLGDFRSYDYMNVIAERFSSVVQSIFGLTILEAITE